MRVIRPKKVGGPEVLVVTEIPTPEPGPVDLLVKVEAIGVNSIDLFRRSVAIAEDAREPVGAPGEPLLLGVEGAGVVEAVGSEVTGFAPGDRVAWAQALGSYATHCIVRARGAVKLPDEIDSRTAAASLVYGLSAQIVTGEVFPLQPGMSCMVFGITYGLGYAIAQIAKLSGATVFGVMHDGAKIALVAHMKLHHLFSPEGRIGPEVRRITEGRGVDVVIDPIGSETMKTAMLCIRRRGALIFCGLAGTVNAPKLDARFLARRGSIYVTRPTLRDFLTTPEELAERAANVFRWVLQKKLIVPIEGTFPLAAARVAHERMEKGPCNKILLIP